MNMYVSWKNSSIIAVIMAIAIGNGMLAGCKKSEYPSPSVPADLVVYGKIFTSDNDKIVEAFAVKDGKFIYVGDKAGAAAFIKEGASEVINYPEGLIIPGCTEGHGHFIGVEGVATMLPGFKASYEELVKTVIPQKMKSNPGPFVSFGWATEKVQKDNKTDYAGRLASTQ